MPTVWLLGVLLLLTSSIQSASQEYQLNCKESAEPNSQLYSLRDGWRCEGVIERSQFGASDFYHLASLTRSVKFDLRDATPIKIQWPAIQGHSGSIHAFPLIEKARPSWRMDGRVVVGRGLIDWPAPKEPKMAADQLGLTVTVTARLGSADYQVFLPVTAVQGRTTEGSGKTTTLRLGLWPWVNLQVVWLTVRHLNVDGQVTKTLWDEKVVGKAAAGVPFWIDLSPFGEPGFYELELGVQNGISSDQEVYHIYIQ